MTRASAYDELKETIARSYPGLSGQLQRIARFALERPNDLALGTVAAIADAVEVQPSALIRFANAIGYGGFSEMQQVFRGRLLERSASYRERIDHLRRTGPAAAGTGVLHQFVSDGVAELGHLEESVHAADVEAAVALLCGSQRIYLLSQRRAFPVAAYLSYALAQLELKSYLLDGVGGMLAESLRCIGSDDLLVVASFHSYSPEVVDAAAAARRRGVPVVAITDSALSPLKPSARVCFELGQGDDHSFRSLVGPLCLAQALVVSAGHVLAERNTAAAKRSTARPSTRRSSNGARR
jgi:DNA-binding MurR/RpiR family transcriptional regulator